LAEQLLPQRILEAVRERTTEYLKEDWILCRLVLIPLRQLGLIERKQKSDWPGIADTDSIRMTPLFERFVQFARIPNVANN
jgi:hypothetical protein